MEDKHEDKYSPGKDCEKHARIEARSGIFKYNVMLSGAELYSHKCLLKLNYLLLLSVHINAPALVIRDCCEQKSAVSGVDLSFDISVLGSCDIKASCLYYAVIIFKDFPVKLAKIKTYRALLGIVIIKFDSK